MADDPNDILIAVLAGHVPADKWKGQPFARIKQLAATRVGDVGQEFVERLCEELGLSCEFPLNAGGKRLRNSPWDIEIEGVTFEIKTASEDVGGHFQFNHIRLHRDYDALLCIGISPAAIYMGAWTKADVATGRAGRLATMEKAANASFKLSKRPDKLRPIADFGDRIMDICTAPGRA